eukprot:CAMPEP_0179623936 /NCGR_PEP_ID=MMETSP0932-20121108/2511_1 /TAXON_ID=548131 ORGANISM="Ostreococcus mediterraneus, Strain clade-D-RCC2596" /NCGR_SAMPLE_ID=MMETSP0932 /ASSEMBLY_ACC=CAM_ASM_000582 /LENGTH=30 /DNA_ID= /DNA_START= /DNA_END= /DNA_ORIENTATION=
MTHGESTFLSSPERRDAADVASRRPSDVSG